MRSGKGRTTWRRHRIHTMALWPEIFVAAPDTRRVRCFVLTKDAYVESVASQLLDVACADAADQIDWPG